MYCGIHHIKTWPFKEYPLFNNVKRTSEVSQFEVKKWDSLGVEHLIDFDSIMKKRLGRSWITNELVWSLNPEKHKDSIDSFSTILLEDAALQKGDTFRVSAIRVDIHPDLLDNHIESSKIVLEMLIQ